MNKREIELLIAAVNSVLFKYHTDRYDRAITFGKGSIQEYEDLLTKLKEMAPAS